MKICLTLTAALLLTLPFAGSAQIEHGGAALGRTLPAPAVIALMSPDLEAYHVEDALNDLDKSIPYRFGVNIDTDFDSDRHGRWDVLPNGDRVWRLGISSNGAVTLNFQFDVFDLPEDGRVFIYSPDMKQVKGSFTRENASSIGSLGVGFIFGESLVIEYQEPAAHSGEGFLHIDMITYGYREVMHLAQEAKAGPFGNAGACNINVNCPQGLPWANQSRSVAVIVVNNNGICTGSLVNNTAQNGTPYFLTANHCLPGNLNNLNNWVFYFNHETPGCSGNTGPTNNSISGASLVANHAESDFGLLLLNNTPPAGWNVCYNGWNATDNPALVSSAVGIHHPRGDVKKICFENNAPYHQSLGTFVNQTWYIDQWELGVTEPASSGSPLFDQSGFLIGVLSGGAAACAGTVNNGQYDFYGRIGVAWNFGPTATTRLRDHLDPGNTGLLIMNSSCSAGPIPNDLTLTGFAAIPSIDCNAGPFAPTLNVFNTGTNAVTSFSYNYSINGGNPATANWNGNLAPGANTSISLPQITPEEGSNTMAASIITVNGVADANETGNTTQASFYAFQQPMDYTLTLDFDDYPQESSWNVTSESGTVLYAAGPYPQGSQNAEVTFCVGETFCFNFTMFDSFGDGMCCQYGNGSYTLTNAMGQVVAQGGSFTLSQTTLVCGPLDTKNHQLNNGLKLYPNPASTLVNVQWSGAAINTSRLYITDIQGRLVQEVAHPFSGGNATQTELSTAGIAPGLYLVTAEAEGNRYTEKLLIQR